MSVPFHSELDSPLYSFRCKSLASLKEIQWLLSFFLCPALVFLTLVPFTLTQTPLKKDQMSVGVLMSEP